MATVLIVEDYPGVAFLYRDILSEEGHNVVVASSAKEACDIVETREIDLVLMNEGLPDGGQEELIRRIKGIRPGIKAVLCALSDSVPETDRNLCDSRFFKSCDYTKLLQEIRDLSAKISAPGQDAPGL